MVNGDPGTGVKTNPWMFGLFAGIFSSANGSMGSNVATQTVLIGRRMDAFLRDDCLRDVQHR